MTTFDPERIENARRRVLEALDEAEYHERRAKTLRSRAAVLTRTWNLDIITGAGVDLVNPETRREAG